MKYTLAEWETFITDAYSSNFTLKEWCRRHQLNFNTFRGARRRLLAKGKLSFLEEKISLPMCSLDSPYAEFPMNHQQAFLVLKPIRSNLSMESMAALIWFDLNLELLPGRVFFFISRNKKQIFALKLNDPPKVVHCSTVRKRRVSMSKYPAIKPKMLTGEECIIDENGNVISDTLGFWRWAYSNIMGNSERGAFAEYLVACALGIADKTRVDWDKYDLLTPEGISVEVKTSGYIQTWDQEKLSNIVFGIRPTLGWDRETNTYSSDKIRQADVYVFCVHKHKEQETINPLDISQWDFYVLKTEILDSKAPEQKSASLASILKMGTEKCELSEIHDIILKLFDA